jgi:rhodanese-related sulfurtransferase
MQPSEAAEHQDEYQLIDVREHYEWDAGHIQGALHIPLAQVMAGHGVDRLDRGRPILCVCRTGNRSELAATMLRARGFEAHNLEGGTERWVVSGYPIVASDGGPGRVA